MCWYVCLHLYDRRPGSLPFLCIAVLVQRLSFGLLIPFHSTGIMCYSNPSPIWGVWRRHEDDVMARTRGDRENHRPSLSQLSMRDRLQRLHAWMITLKVFAHSRSPLSGGRAPVTAVTTGSTKVHFTAQYFRFYRHQALSHLINHRYNRGCYNNCGLFWWINRSWIFLFLLFTHNFHVPSGTCRHGMCKWKYDFYLV